MLRFLLTTGAVFALALPATAQDAEVGEEYEITIATEEDNQYTGPYGQVRIGSVVVNVPNAKAEERYSVRITEIRVNQYTDDRQASCEFEQIGGDRKGMCLGAP
jgi:predicted RNA-binding protein with TRAM domain